MAARDVLVLRPDLAKPGSDASVSTERARSAAEVDRSTPERPGPADPAPSPNAMAAPEDGAKSAQPRSRKLLTVGAAAVLVLAAGAYGANYMLVVRFNVSTDDAYVRANNTVLGARVTSHIAEILPADNSLVHKGDVVFRIDDGDYRIALDDARAKLAIQQATVERVGRQVAAQQAAADQSEANLASANAGMKRFELDYNRQQELVAKGIASRAVYETSEAQRNQGLAAVHGAEAAVNSARANVEVTKGQQEEAVAQVKELETQVAKAERDLGFTEVRAPVDGILSNRLVNMGDYVTVGQRLAYIVPLDQVYIDANFKETQLERVRPGQPVTISVDAYGSRKFAGTVESISPAAGSIFTLLPPDNATGNFTKVVQRLPVRVHVPADVARENLLRAGMSVYAIVDTKAVDVGAK